MAEAKADATGNTDDDWKIFKILSQSLEDEQSKPPQQSLFTTDAWSTCLCPPMQSDEVDLTTSLRSDIAALQYKRDRLSEELSEARGQMRGREQRCLDLQLEAEQMREQAARQHAVIASLKSRIGELEERERALYASQGRSEIAMQGLQRDARYAEDRVRELEQKLRCVEGDWRSEAAKKDAARQTLEDLTRKLATALDVDSSEGAHPAAESLLHRAAELVQEANRLRTRTSSTSDALAAVEIDLRATRDSYERCQAERDILQRQVASQVIELDHLRGAKDAAEVQARVLERDLLDIQTKLASATRSLGNVSGNAAQQEATICQLREEIKSSEERTGRFQQEYRHNMESLALLLGTPARFVEGIEGVIKEHIRELVAETKDKSAQISALRDKLTEESQALLRQMGLCDQATARIRLLEEEKAVLESRVHKADLEISTCAASREGLKRDKSAFMSFLERLAGAMNMDDISHDIGVELHTESLLLRAEQLARLEGDKLADKLRCCGDCHGVLPRLCRQRSFHDLRDTAQVYQLQRKVRNLREQIQRKDLHLDLLRRKLSLLEDGVKNKCLLQHERDEATMRTKKLAKQVDRLQLQLTDERAQVRDLNAQLAEAADYKITALERGRKMEELQKRLIESESLRTRYNRKVSLLKDQVRTTGDTIEQERHLSEQSMTLLRDELARAKEQMREVSQRDAQLTSFRASVAKLLGAPLPLPDYELIARLQKLVDAHHDFTLVSRRYDDPVLRLTATSPTGGSRCTRISDRSRYDDSGYIDPVANIIDDIDDDLYKRPPRPGL